MYDYEKEMRVYAKDETLYIDTNGWRSIWEIFPPFPQDRALLAIADSLVKRPTRAPSR